MPGIGAGAGPGSLAGAGSRARPESAPAPRAVDAAGGFRVRRDLVAGMEDADPTIHDGHLNTLADQPPGHAVGVGVDLDGAVRMHLAGELAPLPERRPAVDRPQGRRLVALEARDRRLAGRAVDAPVGHLAHPPGEMRLERRPAREAPPGDGVALDVADLALVLALGPRSVGCAGLRPHAPVAGESMQPFVEHHLAGLRVVVRDQRAGVVEQDLGRQPAEVAEGALDPVEPRRLPLVPERSDEDAARVAWSRRTGRPGWLGPDVPRSLRQSICICRPGGVSNRTVARASAASSRRMRDRALDGAKADADAALGQEFLPHHVGVAPMAPKRSASQLSNPSRARGRLATARGAQPPRST